MSYPMRRYDPSADETPSVRPMGPVLVEDEPTLATAPAGARLPPGRLPPGISGTDFEQTPGPNARPWLPWTPVGRYISFLPVTVLAVYLVLMLITIGGFLASRGWLP